MDQPSTFRPLAPAPGLSERGVERNLPPRRENVKTACTACKARKQKCRLRGAPPCEGCAKAGTECIIDEDKDMRRKKAVKRKIHELEGGRDLFLDLMDTLRRSDNEKALQLVNLIRSNASIEEVKNFLDHRLDQVEIDKTPELQEVHNRISEYQDMPPQPEPDRRAMMNIRRIVDRPIVNVPASPWTTVTADDSLVSHLISLWLTWCHPIWNYLDPELFARDMQGARLDCEFCSPFLVNSILAEACFYSDYPECFTIPGDMASRGAHFYDEASRLLEKEAGRVSLPTLQGIATLKSCADIMGKDRLGRMYLGMANRAVDEYAVCERVSAEQREGKLSITDRVTNNTVWGVFNVATMNCFSTMKTTSLNPPKRPRKLEIHDGNDLWSPYPGPSVQIAAHRSCVFNSSCDFAYIQYEICQSLFHAGNRPSYPGLKSTVNTFYQRLQQWYEQLPPCISSENLTVPHVMSLHIFYHASILQIYRFLRNLTPEEDSTSGVANANEMCFSAAKEISTLTEIHRSKWGIERMSSTMIHGVMASMFALLDDLVDAENRSAFIELCTIARAFARRSTLARGILRMIHITADQMGVPMPSEVEALLADFESQSWGPKDRERISSGYPNFATILRPGEAAENYEMDSFLERWDKLRV